MLSEKEKTIPVVTWWKGDILGFIREGFMKEEVLVLKLRLFRVYSVRNESGGNSR